ncbi:MAG: hypothetical protein HFG73_11075 [Hungatella sp.]|jgi:hypothetical protein|nr:hypothetical protein [Hungatella sp.]
MRFWKEHGNLRIIIMTVFFAAGLAMVIGGWKMTGKMTGLGIMILGLVLLLSALMIYNKPFEDPKR